LDGGVSDPTASHLSAGAASFNSGLLVVVGSYLIASEVQVRRPARRGARPATVLARAPLTDEEAALRAG
jgi:hypothetical protein